MQVFSTERMADFTMALPASNEQSAGMVHKTANKQEDK
jgi:hypothetical protein